MSQDSVAGLTSWIARQYPGADVSARADAIRDVIVFSATPTDGSGTRMLEITDEAMADVPVVTIIEDLEQQGVPSLLRRDPTMRRTYSSDRKVPHFEQLRIECGGRQYRVVRDSSHNVRIFDDQDLPLDKLPPSVLAMDASIFRRPMIHWCTDVSKWRGPSQ